MTATVKEILIEELIKSLGHLKGQWKMFIIHLREVMFQDLSLVKDSLFLAYHLSKYLETQFGFISSGQNAWGFLTAGFKTGGTSYQLRMDAMNSTLVAKENKGKRGKYKKRRR